MPCFYVSFEVLLGCGLDLTVKSYKPNIFMLGLNMNLKVCPDCYLIFTMGTFEAFHVLPVHGI